jgi:hypothetical protein
VKQGEQLDNANVGTCGLGQPVPVLQHPCPMSYAVDAEPRQIIIVENTVNKTCGRRHIAETLPAGEFAEIDGF